MYVCTLRAGVASSFSFWDGWYKGSKCVMHCMLCIMCMSTLSRQRIKALHAFNAMYVDTVNTKHIHTFLHITFLIFNWFSIWKQFWNTETLGFSIISSNTIYMLILLIWVISISNAFNAMYVDTVITKHIHTFLPITFLIFNWFWIQKKLWIA